MQAVQALCYYTNKPREQAQGKATKRINAMTNSNLFKQAHTMTKATIKAGDDYQVTFGQCLKVIKAAQQAPKKTRKVRASDVGFYFSWYVVIAVVIALLGFVVATAPAVVSVPVAVFTTYPLWSEVIKHYWGGISVAK